MNNPFDYIPSGKMMAEQQNLVMQIESLRDTSVAFREDVDKGKMFGILITDKGVLHAFSGQIGDSFNWPGFVPPVYDYLDETGYFKTHEREISLLNQQIFEIENSKELAEARKNQEALVQKSENDINDYKQQIKEAKELRDKKRSDGDADEAELLRESQFMKAELHRKKVNWRRRLVDAQRAVDDILSDIRLMKLQRQHKSDHLQRWLFEQFVFKRPDGTDVNLVDVFQNYHTTSSTRRIGEWLPPSGSGECCEPKLLHYAFSHQLKPMEIGMFWWGASPKQEIRHHLQFYPACNGKCKPILSLLLEDSFEAFHKNIYNKEKLDLLFEDESIIVVNKPSGMLSVPGKDGQESVFSIMRQSHCDCTELAMVHRLDMDTSGVMVVAKTKEAHKNLQEQFARHTIRKEYVALLEKPVSLCPTLLKASEGRIELPLRPDYEDRPRQLVDTIHGNAAITDYQSLGDNLILLRPQTGRTHQLRVHCAHQQGLNNPIKGDRLYGKKGDRLCLHARKLEFQHPVSGEWIKFETECTF